jgi:hypothetical protein
MSTKLLILCVLFWFQLSAEGVHLIIAGDTQSNLRQQVQKDVSFMQNRGRALANELGKTYRPSFFIEDHLTRSNLLSHLDSKSFDASDIVIFYFTGHGFRTKDKQSKWPNLYFTKNDTFMALDEIVERLARKNPQFALVIADCCNNYTYQPMPSVQYFSFESSSHHTFHPKVAELFKSSRGLLVISGAEPGGFSWSNDEGGILTAAFFEALGFRSRSAVNWDLVQESVKQQTKHIQKVQMARILPRR